MTQLLEKAFKKASRLPENEQDAFAQLMLAELEAEQRWSELFEQSQDVLERLADEALAEHRTGRTQRLNPEDL